MKGFIEIERKDTKSKELLCISHIVSVQASDIMLNAVLDNGYTQNCYIVSTGHTYEELKQKIAEATSNE